MKAKELIAELSKLDGETEIYIPNDGEGFSTNLQIATDMRFYSEMYSDEDLDPAWMNKEVIKKIKTLPKVVVIWP